MSQSLAKKHTVGSLLRFALPTIIMMVFMSLYTIVDGLFISRFVGTSALSSANIVYPVINIIIGAGIMLASGGNAIIAKYIGEGRNKDSRKVFTMITATGIILGITILILGNLFIEPLVRLLGANQALEANAIAYLQIILYFSPALMLQLLFQTFFVTEGKPHLGLILTIFSGITNIILDYVFIVPLDMGIKGAALATGIGYTIPSVFGLIYFFRSRHSLYFTRFTFSAPILSESCLNGSSEMVTQLSTGIITFMFNLLTMKYAGATGVAAITIIQYSEYLLNALFMGFSMGIAPIISYNYGSQNIKQIKRLIKTALCFCIGCSLILTIASKTAASPLIRLFTDKGTDVYNLAYSGFHLFSWAFIFSGTNIFASALFTALSDGKTSALISFLRTFFFTVLTLITLPNLIGLNGIWTAVPLAEACTIILSIILIKRLWRKTLNWPNTTQTPPANETI